MVNSVPSTPDTFGWEFSLPNFYHDPGKSTHSHWFPRPIMRGLRRHYLIGYHLTGIPSSISCQSASSCFSVLPRLNHCTPTSFANANANTNVRADPLA